MGRSTSLRFVPGGEDIVMRPPTEKTAEEAALIAECLRANPNLKRLAPFSTEQVDFLVKMAWKEVVERGRPIMLEGDLSNETFYIVNSGSFSISATDLFEVVSVQGMSYLSRPDQPSKAKESWSPKNKVKTVRQVGKNTCFGDSSMLYCAPRWATIVALEHAEVWVFSQANFKAAQLQGGQADPTAKTEEDRRLIDSVLSSNQNLQQLTTLGSAHIKDLVSVAWREELQEGQVLMMEGDLNADALYIVAEGELEFTGSEPFEVVTRGSASHLARAAHTSQSLSHVSKETPLTRRLCGRGLCFGEISMLYCAPRFATVRATRTSVLWAIDRSNFVTVQMKAAADEVRARVRFLNGLQALQSFANDDKEKVAAVMETMRFVQGEVIAREGEEGRSLCILYEGSADVSTKGESRRKVEADVSTGSVHMFGEEVLLRPQAWPETVTVTSPVATALILEHDEFTKVMDRLLEAAPSPAFQRYTTTKSKVNTQPDALSISNFEKVGLLGVGAMGPIELVRNSATMELYALKTMSKGLIMQRGLRQSVLRERKVWAEVISPFVIHLVATYRDEDNLSLLLEAALGGELSTVYATHQFFGSNRHAVYYAAGCVLGLEHLHKRKIMYRNLKPHNILISQAGHPKLVDFQLAKHVVGHTFTTCGTPTYMAPEIVAGTGHTRAVDWWSMGILLFWLMTGRTPFESAHPMEVYAKVMRGIGRVDFPDSCRGSVGDLINSLLNRSAIDRLPMRQGGIQNVMGHPWFADMDWSALRALAVEPPHAPEWDTSPRNWKDSQKFDAAGCLKYFAPKADTLPKTVDHVGLADWDSDFPSH